MLVAFAVDFFVVDALVVIGLKEQYPSYNFNALVTSWLLYLHLVMMQLLRNVVAVGRRSVLQKHAFRICLSPHSR